MSSKLSVCRKAGAVALVALLSALLFAVPAYADDDGSQGIPHFAPVPEFDVPEGAVSGTWGSDDYAAQWYLADDGETLIVGPGVVCSSSSYLSPGEVSPDFGGRRAQVRTVCFTQDAYMYPTATDLFAGFESLERIEGMSRLSGGNGVLHAENMFAGCKALKSISIGDIRFSSYQEHPYTGGGMGVTDVFTSCKGAFEGCTSLEALDLGEGWYSGHYGPGAFTPEDMIFDDRATFPVDMTDGTTVYAAGSPVPDGEGHYKRVAETVPPDEKPGTVDEPDPPITDEPVVDDPGSPVEDHPAVDVEKRSVSGATAVSRVYTGRSMEPVVTLGGMRLVRGVDYTCTVRDSSGKVISSGKAKKAGKYRVEIAGIGGFTGTETITFTVKKANMRNVSVSRIKSRAYTGKPIRPSVKATFYGKSLKKGVDFSLSYKNNKARGTASVKVKGKGNFTGVKSVEFRIS